MLTKQPTVKILADSIHEGHRMTTFQLTYWRPLLAEINTHCMLSKNAGSSRAKSFNKRCSEIMQGNVFVPMHWNTEQPGMTSGEEFDDITKEIIEDDIELIAMHTADALKKLNAKILERTGKEIHKQYLNRYLEPFISVDQVISGTEWDNFFKLRCAPDAQPEVRDVAMQMRELMQTNIPVETHIHLPYITEEEKEKWTFEVCKQISVARCARVSYRTYEGNITMEKDIELCKRLGKNGHMSPFEHIAIAAQGKYYKLNGWRSYRYELEFIDGGAEGRWF